MRASPPSPHFTLKMRQSGSGLRRTFIYFSACPWGAEGALSPFGDMSRRASLLEFIIPGHTKSPEDFVPFNGLGVLAKEDSHP